MAWKLLFGDHHHHHDQIQVTNQQKTTYSERIGTTIPYIQENMQGVYPKEEFVAVAMTVSMRVPPGPLSPRRRPRILGDTGSRREAPAVARGAAADGPGAGHDDPGRADVRHALRG